MTRRASGDTDRPVDRPRRPPRPPGIGEPGDVEPDTLPIKPDRGPEPAPLPDDPGIDRTTADAPDPVIAQAKRDIDAGLVDTDMHATPGLDAALRARLVPGAGGTPPPGR